MRLATQLHGKITLPLDEPHVRIRLNMAKYAILRIKGKQYRVEDGQEVLVDLLEGKPEAEILLTVDGDMVKVGKPIVAGAKVSLKVVTEMEKGEKINIFKYKAKSRYRKRMGFTPKFTRLLVEKVSQ